MSDHLLRMIHDEFRAHVASHDVPCMLAEHIVFDRSRLQRVSLQSLRRTDLEAAPRGTVILFCRASDNWTAFARVIPDQQLWIRATAQTKNAALALLDDGIHRRPRPEWMLGDPNEIAHQATEIQAWAGVMSIVP